MLSKYKRRPESLEDICYTQFGKMYRSGGASKHDDEEEEEDIAKECDSDEEDEEDENEDPEQIFHYLITEDDVLGPQLPKTIKLKDQFPKENPIMRKRTRPVAIRFHKSKRENNPFKFYLSELMMYVPFREEEEEFKPDDLDLSLIHI